METETKNPFEVALSEVLMQGIDDPNTNPHPFDGKCKVCEQPLIGQLWRQIDHKRAPGWFPVNCCDTCYENAKKSGSSLDVRLRDWEAQCPLEFRKDWDSRMGNSKALSRVLSFNPSLGRGLLIQGVSGSGKTRMAWRLMRELSSNGVGWQFVESIDLLDQLPENAYTVPVLAIDDLGNDMLSGPREVKLLKLIRSRVDWHRPIIITTQFNGESLAERFSDSNTARAVIRRLRQFCDIAAIASL